MAKWARRRLRRVLARAAAVEELVAMGRGVFGVGGCDVEEEEKIRFRVVIGFK